MRRVRGSRRRTAPAASATQSAAGDRERDGGLPRRHGVGHVVGRGVDPHHSAVLAIGRPHRPEADRDGAWTVAHRDRLHDVTGHSIDAEDQARLLCCRPYRVGRHGQRDRLTADRGTAHAARPEVDPHDLAVQRRGRPDRTAPDRERTQAIADRDPLHDAVGHRIHLGDSTIIAAGHPQRSRVERQRHGRDADVDRVDPFGLGMDARHRRLERTGDPHRARAAGNRASGRPDAVLRRDRSGAGIDHADPALVDARQPVGAGQTGHGEDGDGDEDRARRRDDEAPVMKGASTSLAQKTAVGRVAASRPARCSPARSPSSMVSPAARRPSAARVVFGGNYVRRALQTFGDLADSTRTGDERQPAMSAFDEVRGGEPLSRSGERRR